MKTKGFSLLNLRRTRVGKNKKKRGMLRQIYSFFRIKSQQSVEIFLFCKNFQFRSIFEQNSNSVLSLNKIQALLYLRAKFSIKFQKLQAFFHPPRRPKPILKRRSWSPSGDSNSSRWMKTCRSSKIQLLYPHPSWTFQATRKTTPPCWRLALQFGSLTWRTG